MSQEEIGDALCGYFAAAFGAPQDFAASAADALLARYWLAPKPDIASRPAEGEEVWLLMRATVKPDHWQGDAEDHETVVEIEGGWTYNVATDELIRPSQSHLHAAAPVAPWRCACGKYGGGEPVDRRQQCLGCGRALWPQYLGVLTARSVLAAAASTAPEPPSRPARVTDGRTLQ